MHGVDNELVGTTSKHRALYSFCIEQNGVGYSYAGRDTETPAKVHKQLKDCL